MKKSFALSLLHLKFYSITGTTIHLALLPFVILSYVLSPQLSQILGGHNCLIGYLNDSHSDISDVFSPTRLKTPF